MELYELLKHVPLVKVTGDATLPVTSLHYDSRRVEPGGVFFALRGVEADGHRFIPAAIAAGATVVVLEDPASIPEGVTSVLVTDSRLALSRMASAFYGDPANRFRLVGITGTNGKTTTTYLVEAMLRKAGVATAVLGTVSYRFGELAIPAPHTTPESLELQRMLREMADLGAQGVVMEVSSHSLEQRRVDGCRFDVGIFTNLTPEHLDYHGDMESYLSSKARLFTDLLVADDIKPLRRAAINTDDPYGRRLAAACACPVVTYGLNDGEVTARDVTLSVEGIRGTLVTPHGERPFSSPMMGRFNLYNILAAAAAGVALDLSLGAVVHGIEQHQKVPGRLERVENESGFALLVDYAHTGDALENVLRTVQEIARGRIITVFGCGGDRDRTKRPVMGRVAAGYSDLSIITSDNPRTEDPAAIISQVREGVVPLQLREYLPQELANGFSAKGFTVVQDRREAIRLAVRLAAPGDVVLLAGKGHEDYQIIGKEKFHFDDREEAAAAFREREGD